MLFKKKYISFFKKSIPYFFILFLCYTIYKSLFKNPVLSFSCDESCSEYAVHLIHEQLATIESAAPLKTILLHIQQCVPSIAQATRLWYATGESHVQFFSEPPLVRINNNWIFTTQGNLYEDRFFSSRSYALLNHCFVHDLGDIKTNKNNDLLRFFREKAPRLYEFYTILWYDKTCIELREKRDHARTFYITADKEINDAFFAEIKTLDRVLEQTFTKKADMRFKAYTIVSA